MGIDTTKLMEAVNLELEQAGSRVRQCLSLLGAEMISWIHVPDPCDPLRVGRDELKRLVEAIPDLEAAELTIAADILLNHAPDRVVADWLIGCMTSADLLINQVGHGLRLREMLEVVEGDEQHETATACGTGRVEAERYNVHLYGGNLILWHAGAYAVARPSDVVAGEPCCAPGSTGPWTISSPEFAAVAEAEAWIDAGCPDGTED